MLYTLVSPPLSPHYSLMRMVLQLLKILSLSPPPPSPVLTCSCPSIRTPEQSAHARDAMAKALYAATFSWVVAHTNKSIQGDGASAAVAAAADGVAGAVAGVSTGAEFNTDKMYVNSEYVISEKLCTQKCLSTAAPQVGRVGALLSSCCACVGTNVTPNRSHLGLLLLPLSLCCWCLAYIYLLFPNIVCLLQSR